MKWKTYNVEAVKCWDIPVVGDQGSTMGSIHSKIEKLGIQMLTWASKKTLRNLPLNPGCWIGVLVMAYWNPPHNWWVVFHPPKKKPRQPWGNPFDIVRHDFLNPPGSLAHKMFINFAAATRARNSSEFHGQKTNNTGVLGKDPPHPTNLTVCRSSGVLYNGFQSLF